MKSYLQELIVAITLGTILIVCTISGVAKITDVKEVITAIILIATLIVFTLGKSPLFRVDRVGMAIIGATLMMSFGIMTIDEAILAIDAKTIIILFSLMVVVSNLKIAGFFSYIGKIVFTHIHNCKMLLIAVILVSGLLSSIIINDIVCLLFTPVVIMICLKTKINPIPFLLAVAMASNIGSACTFMGNPQNILIGNLSQISAGEYFLVSFPVTFIGFILLYVFLLVIYKQDLNKSFNINNVENIAIHKYLVIKTIIVLLLIILFYLLGFELALMASFGAVYLLINNRVKPERVYENIDFNLLIIFMGLFIIIAGVEKSGLLGLIYNYLPVEYINQIPFFAILAIILSNIVSNVPAVLLLKYYIPVDEQILWQVLALLSTIAGNLTIFGSIANLIVVESAKKYNIKVNSKDYLKIGFPLTIILSILSICWFEFLK